MELKAYPLLSTRSKRLMVRRFDTRRREKGRIYHYAPRRILLNRLAQQLNMNERSVRKLLFQERLHLLQEIYGKDVINEGHV